MDGPQPRQELNTVESLLADAAHSIYTFFPCHDITKVLGVQVYSRSGYITLAQLTYNLFCFRGKRISLYKVEGAKILALCLNIELDSFERIFVK